MTFNWRDANSSTAAQIGLIAQDVANVFPEIVTRGATSTLAPDGALGIQYTGLIPPIVKAIQELNLKLEDLATTTSATSTDQSSFTTRFFASLFARLTQWFADAQNGITDFFARRVHTQEICTTPSDGMQVCASADQLAAILAGTSAGAPREQGAPASTSGPNIGGGSDTATTTTSSDNEPAVDEEEGAADTPSAGSPQGAPAASSTSEGTNADATTTTIPAAIDPDGGDAPAANDNQPVEDEPVQVEMGMAEELPEAANDNSPADPLPATGTDG